MNNVFKALILFLSGVRFPYVRFHCMDRQSQPERQIVMKKFRCVSTHAIAFLLPLWDEKELPLLKPICIVAVAPNS